MEYEQKLKSSFEKVRAMPSRLGTFWGSLGPGIITGAADDDPSGIGTYTQAGALYGTTFLWAALLTWPLMAVVQMACARIGMVTGEGLASALEKKFPRPVLVLVCAALFFANTLNVGADLSAMADCAEMLNLGSSHAWVVVFAALMSWATVQLRYFHLAHVLKWLAVFLFAYIAVAFWIGPDWSAAAHDTVVPQLPKDAGQWSMLVAILGTTISPYLFFWQASQEVEEEKAAGRDTIEKRLGATPVEIRTRWYDVGIGTLFSNVVMFFIILASAYTLHTHGLTNIETSAQAAIALKPLAGRAASLLYSLGLIGTGLLAIPTLTGSAAYALAETFGWDHGLDAPIKKARAFYVVILASTVFAVIFDFSNINAIKALYWSAVANGVLAPFLLLGIFVVMKDKVLMKGQPSSISSQALVVICMLLMFGAMFGMFYF